MSNDGKIVRIAVDSMGGDYAPGEVIKGAIMAAREGNMEIILVGPMEILEQELAKHDSSLLPISFVNADEVIKEGEHPAFAIRRKPNASIAVATELVKTGMADAIISAGPTGAASVSAINLLGMMPGLERPALCVPLVGLAPNTVLVDGGANIDCKPHQLLSFAAIGSVYAKKLFNVTTPKVALLSIGAEEGKGSRLIQESYQLLQKSNLNFVGNIEGYDILSGQANVIICDGVVGNIITKFYESIGHYFVGWLKAKWGNLPLGRSVKKLLDLMVLLTRLTRNESDGGGLLWGVNGIVHLMHGNSQAQQVNKSIARAKHAVEIDLISSLRSELTTVRSKLPITS